MRQGLIFIACLLFSIENNAQKITVGLASTIQLQPGQTEIVKSDYFPFGSKYIKVKWPQGLQLINETATTYVVKGKLVRPIDNIQFIYEDDTVDIPCRMSRKAIVSQQIILAQPAYKLAIKGSFNGWQANEKMLKPMGQLPTRNWQIDTLEANFGIVQYKLIADGIETDPTNIPLVNNSMGGTNAVVQIGEPDIIKPVGYTDMFDDESIRIKTTNANYYLAYLNNSLISKGNIPISGNISIVMPKEISSGRSFIRVFISNKNAIGNDILIPLDNGKVVTNPEKLNRTDHHTQIMYFMMVDRFLDGNKANNPKPLPDVLPKAQYLGGDLKGIELKINDGYFEKMGVNTLWLSPISQNPAGAWGYWNKEVTTKFSAYHGYWPTSYSKIDNRFGTAKQFTDLITNAHAKKTNIVLDFVAHHIHVDHPLYKKHPEWATPLYLPDGTMNTERWDDHRLTTWFDTFLPTLNFENESVRELVSDSVLFWVKKFEIDGFRHDASKHVPESFWRLLTQKIKIQNSKTNRSFYQIGETYGSADLIGSYVNSGQMDAQFDFNLYDASIVAFATDETNTKQEQNWNQLKNTIDESFNYYGWHHLMGNISGNQDRPRFTSIADGSVSLSEDTKLAGWTRKIENQNDKGYARMAQLMALNMTLPGVPVIYYGDEYGMPGGNDPDNRRMMQFDHYNAQQMQLINKVKLLTNLRKTNMALLYGEYKVIDTEKHYFAFERNYFGSRVIIVFSKNAGRATLPLMNGTTYKTLFSHKTTQLENEIQVEMNADDMEIFILNTK